VEIAGLVAFGFNLADLAEMDFAELEMWVASSAEYTRLTLGPDNQD
jgi:hypothetical protein